ncbi:alpha-L-arabinofuranosidase 1-like [Hordeum vulgare]|nr:alpha-L-arabinofuranosidase 1-like [Hordeum vulgare]
MGSNGCFFFLLIFLLSTFTCHGVEVSDVQIEVSSSAAKKIPETMFGGCFVEGELLRNAFRWKETIGPWEQRPGHFGDVWHYWTDDGLGYYEFLQLAEDLGATPIWVVNIGISHHDKVNITDIAPLVEDILDSLEFAKGSAESKWGSVRSSMGHPEPFLVKYVALGNEDCVFNFYREHYLKFHTAIREAYPDIQMISNCDGSRVQLDHPADLYDFHVKLPTLSPVFGLSFLDRIILNVFVSEYAAVEEKPGDGGNGSLVASLAEAAFLTGIEKNSDIVQMASYAPLFVNDNDHTWMPDAIVFNSWQQYGTPSYWMQTFFRESSGALIHPITINSSYSQQLAASAITWQDSKISFLRVKIVNFGPVAVNLTISVSGLEASVNSARSVVTVLTSSNPLMGTRSVNQRRGGELQDASVIFEPAQDGVHGRDCRNGQVLFIGGANTPLPTGVLTTTAVRYIDNPAFLLLFVHDTLLAVAVDSTLVADVLMLLLLLGYVSACGMQVGHA